MISRILSVITPATFFSRTHARQADANDLYSNDYSTKDDPLEYRFPNSQAATRLRRSSVIGAALLGMLIPYQASSNSCAQTNEITAVTTETPYLDQEDEKFFKEVEDKLYQSHQNLARSVYRFLSAGIDKNLDTKAIYDQYPILQQKETVERLQKLYNQHPDNLGIRRVFFFLLEFRYIANKLSEAGDKLIETQAKGERNNAITIELLRQRNKLLKEFGFDTVKFFSAARTQDLTQLGKAAEELLKLSSENYQAHMPVYSIQENEQSQDEKKWTVFYKTLRNLESLDPLIKEGQGTELSRRTFKLLGMDLADVAVEVDFKTDENYWATINNSNRKSPILMDTEDRPNKKHVTPYTFPASPKEVYVTLVPNNGWGPRVPLHELGHAMHYSNEDESKAFSKIFLGSKAAMEAYAFLFEHLTHNKHWLEHVAGLTKQEAKQVQENQTLAYLGNVRHNAGKMLYELELYKSSLGPDQITTMSKRYEEIMTDATGYDYDGYSEGRSGWLPNMDPFRDGFFVAHYFAAFILEAQLREYMQQTFGTLEHNGEDWYQNPEAGKFLKTLWKEEGNPDPDILSKHLGYEGSYDINPLIHHVKKVLQDN